MADIALTSNSTSITALREKLEFYKYNPSAIQRLILDHLSEITDGNVNIVDPTNPFIFLLESSAVNTSLAISENISTLRKLYPSLTENEEDLYLHMSDKDFINRFATPANAKFTMVIQVSDILNKMLYDSTNNCYRATIPKDTKFIIDGIVFTLNYPINIKKYINGVVQISYDNTETSPLQTLSSNIIDYTIRKDSSQIDWLFFNIDLKQFSVESSYFTLQKSIIFSNDINYTDSFYYIRVFYKNTNTSNNWVEMLTTYTDQVFDNTKPTAVIKVMSNKVNVFIPPVYLMTDIISGEIKIDIYTTKGELNINLSNYKLESFSTSINNNNDYIDEYVATILNMTYYAYSIHNINSGSNSVDFQTLRKRVIENSVGDRQFPITNAQIASYVNNLGFDIIKNIDVLTNRIFLATKKLPKPINSKLLTSANIGISTAVINLNNNDKLENNGDRVTIKSNNLFINKNGITSMLTNEQHEAIINKTKLNMLADINSNAYLYNPFYYVLDSSENEFEVRAYHLDSPQSSNLNFISQNQTLQLVVNTLSHSLEKITNGYKLTIVTKSGNFYKQLPDNSVNIQLGYQPIGENKLAYINGSLIGKTDDGERIYTFILETNHDIKTGNYINILNGSMFNSDTIKTWIELLPTAHIFYTTTSITTNYIPSSDNNMLGTFLLEDNSALITHESILLNLGYSLSNLWTRSRSLATNAEYERYKTNVPLLYDRVIYEIDPITNSIFSIDGSGNLSYNILHNIGDPVLNNEGEALYKHKINDIVLDYNGKPIFLSDSSFNKELDLLLVDGKYYFSNEASFKDYKIEYTNLLNSWIINDIGNIKDVLLEQTKIYFYPKTNHGFIKIQVDDKTDDTISSEQIFTINLYVNNAVYKDADIRSKLARGTIELLDEALDTKVINMTDISFMLRDLYKNSVISFDVSGLGGNKNYKVITILDEQNRVCLKKKLVLQTDGSFIIEEDVIINFYNIERVLS